MRKPLMTKNMVTPSATTGSWNPFVPQSPKVVWKVCPHMTERAAIARRPLRPGRWMLLLIVQRMALSLLNSAGDIFIAVYCMRWRGLVRLTRR